MPPLPIAEAIIAVAGAVRAGFEWACTPVGQACSKQWLEDGQAFRKAADDLGNWVEGLFRR